MAKPWTDLAALRGRIERVAQMICLEEGLERPQIHVRIDYPQPGKPRRVVVEIEEHTAVDGTDPRWESVRGVKWGDN